MKIGVRLGVDCKGTVSGFPFIVNIITIAIISKTNDNNTVCLQMLTYYSIHNFVIYN